MSSDPSHRLLWASLLVGSLLSVIVSYRVATLSFVLGSNEGRWVHEYLQRFPRRSFEVLVLALVICGAAAVIPLSLVRRYEWQVVVVWILVGFAVQGLLRSQTRYTFEQMFVSDGSNSFYSPTQQYSAAVMLSDFDRLRPTLPTHARANMPGKLMFVYALEVLSRNPKVLPWLIVGVSNLGAVLLYVFVRDFFADRVVALVSLIFYLFVPGKLFFFPVLNTVTPVVILFFACLWLRWLKTRVAAYAALLGVALYGLVFYEPLPLVMGLCFAGLTARALRRAELDWRTFLLHGGIAVLAFALVHAAMLAWFGFDLIATFRQVLAEAAEFNVKAQRPYSIWVSQNLLDFGFGMGVCQALLFFIPIGAAIQTGRLGEPIAALSLGLAAVLLAADLLGVNRGEVVRLWIFLACFFQIPAAYVCAQLKNRAAVMLVLGTTLVQGALGTAMLGFATP